MSNTEEMILRQGNCIGTYIHGFLDNAPVINSILRPYCTKTHTPAGETAKEFRMRQYDLLAEHVRKYVDTDKIYKILSC